MGPGILIIEDEAEIADTLKYALKEQGMIGAWVATGQQARTVLADQHDLVES